MQHCRIINDYYETNSLNMWVDEMQSGWMAAL